MIFVNSTDDDKVVEIVYWYHHIQHAKPPIFVEIPTEVRVDE